MMSQNLKEKKGQSGWGGMPPQLGKSFEMTFYPHHNSQAFLNKKPFCSFQDQISDPSLKTQHFDHLNYQNQSESEELFSNGTVQDQKKNQIQDKKQSEKVLEGDKKEKEIEEQIESEDSQQQDSVQIELDQPTNQKKNQREKRDNIAFKQIHTKFIKLINQTLGKPFLKKIKNSKIKKTNKDFIFYIFNCIEVEFPQQKVEFISQTFIQKIMVFRDQIKQKQKGAYKDELLLQCQFFQEAVELRKSGTESDIIDAMKTAYNFSKMRHKTKFKKAVQGVIQHRKDYGLAH